MSIPSRLSRLEAAVASGGNATADAAKLVERIELIASRFPEDAAAIPLEERLRRMSAAEHCAWAMRFMDQPTPVAAIISMHAAHRSGHHHADY